MAITTKPTAYTVNTAHSKCPDHLWMFDENTGSVSYDQGKSSSKRDITLYDSGAASSALWGSDALGTVITCRDATISSRYGISSTLTWEATSSLLIVAIWKSTSTGGTANEAIAGFGTSTTGSGKGYLRGQPNVSSYLDAYHDDITSAYAHNGNSAVPVYSQAWTMCYAKWKTGELGVAIDNGDWQVTTNASTWPTTGASPNRFGVGADVDSTPANFANGQLLALFVYNNDYTNWTNTWVDDLYADPWQFLTTTGKKLKMLTHASAAGATGIEGVVLNSTRDTVIGEFSGQAFEGTLESGKAVLKVPVGDFGGSALTTSDTPLALAKNTTKTTGLVSCTVIEE